ncbi:hypothetical protein [Algoriphagus sp.]|uniref:hypothetical protein n=1 Tax=Algoriphagus sp. TaxID=1872435 RepID=UPI00391CC624
MLFLSLGYMMANIQVPKIISETAPGMASKHLLPWAPVPIYERLNEADRAFLIGKGRPSAPIEFPKKSSAFPL